jgi:hypothetical protein
MHDPAADVTDDGAMAQARLQALALGDGTDWSRCGDHQVLHALSVAPPSQAPAAPVAMMRLVAPPAPAPAPAPPAPSPAPRAAAPAAPAPAAEGTFGAALDVAAMVAVLQQAARDGVPFCEECARAAAAAA